MSLRVRPMTAADLPLGMRLKEQAGWNQLEADWVRFLDLEPQGAFVAVLDDTPVGTLAFCRFGPVAWIAMVLVEASVRRRGVGRALMEHALEVLDRRGVGTVRLDATPLGQPLYEQLGFVTEYTLTRFEGAAPRGEALAGVLPAGPEYREAILALDRAATGTERGRMIARLLDEYPGEARVAMRGGEVEGYLTARPGARALYVGPCVARGDAGEGLLADAWQRHTGEVVFIDVPDANGAALAAVRAAGLAAQRPLMRMYRGVRVDDRPGALWASAGPEKG